MNAQTIYSLWVGCQIIITSPSSLGVAVSLIARIAVSALTGDCRLLRVAVEALDLAVVEREIVASDRVLK